MAPLKLVVTGGGTGGHVYPALAVIDALNQSDTAHVISFVGNKKGMEADKVPQRGIPFYGLNVSGMPRGKAMLKFFPWCIQLLKAVYQSRTVLAQLDPQVVFGTGGYVSAPVLMAANTLGIPTVIHEPDAHPGLVNRLMSRWATHVTGAFPQAKDILGGTHFTVTGNPLGTGVGRWDKADARRSVAESLELMWPPDALMVLITGGSQGAKTINQAVVDALPEFLQDERVVIIHQSGSSQYHAVLDQLSDDLKHHPRYRVRPFYESMAPLLGAADVMVGRAGSMTLSEIYAAGLPSILIPYPYAAADHQRKNAQASVDAGASVMVMDSDLTGKRLKEELMSLLNQPALRQERAHAARALAHLNAVDDIVSILQETAAQST